MRLVLAGSLQLDELFTAPELEVFSQRLTARCYLAPLSHHEMVQYARAQVSAAGAKPEELFAPEALDALYQATDGIPRLVNQICDRALLLAVDRRLNRIDKSIIEAAWADLQQLPTPWAVACEPPRSGSTGVIEFGSLDENDPAVVEEPTEIEPADDEPNDDETTSVGPTMRVFQSPPGEEEAPAPENCAESPSRVENLAEDPFAESFQEEEVVLDRYATLETAFHVDTPRVINRRETSWSQILRDAESIEEHVAADPSTPAEHEAASPLATGFEDSQEDIFRERPQPSFARPAESFGSRLANVTADAVEESDVLCIEDDSPPPAINNRQVERKEYRQLFASLRGD